MFPLVQRERFCPSCWSRDIQPSRFRGLEWLLSIVGIRPSRCITCFERFWMWSYKSGKDTASSRGRLDTAQGTTGESQKTK